MRGPSVNPGMPTPEEWGTYCKHGVKIMEQNPGIYDADGYPIGRIVEPWPCEQGCTREGFELELQEMEAEYHESLRAD